MSNLGKLKSIKGVTWDWKPEYRGGVIAQEVKKILPEAIGTTQINGKPFMTVDYTKVTGLLVEAVKELADRVEELEKEKQ